ncbi:hypothetical protein [Streptomyces mobaraensis]|uniref:hypothetical protein n=1 Tax=Streptomyces mobaraensis TaxID=35621 RepID=UPI00179B2D26|nr:hypothetical protein [Streptomyces mobaraensis]MBC2877847.1 hypothetical protein [Streptomyces sp. TYQ1024]UBI37984.1 hypothetical protein K7I03_16905 [Streptomyces mobaraensis]
MLERLRAAFARARQRLLPPSGSAGTPGHRPAGPAEEQGNAPAGLPPREPSQAATALARPCTREAVLARPMLPTTLGGAQPWSKRYRATLLAARCDNAPEACR